MVHTSVSTGIAFLHFLMYYPLFH